MEVAPVPVGLDVSQQVIRKSKGRSKKGVPLVVVRRRATEDLALPSPALGSAIRVQVATACSAISLPLSGVPS